MKYTISEECSLIKITSTWAKLKHAALFESVPRERKDLDPDMMMDGTSESLFSNLLFITPTFDKKYNFEPY